MTELTTEANDLQLFLLNLFKTTWTHQNHHQILVPSTNELPLSIFTDVALLLGGGVSFLQHFQPWIE